MTIIEKIKNLINGRNQFLLKEYNTETLEDGIKKYLDNLVFLNDANNNLTLSDYALQMINAHFNNEKNDKNGKIESKFIERMRDENKVIRNPKTSFKPAKQYLIHSPSYNIDELNQNTKRMYINLKRKNIVKFADKFIKYSKKHPFCIKMYSDYSTSEIKRNNSVTVYMKDEEEEFFNIVVKKIWSRHPKIMEGTENKNPFLQNGKIEGTSIGDQYEYMNLEFNDGITKEINSISYALYYAFKTTMAGELNDPKAIKKYSFNDMIKIYEKNYANNDNLEMKEKFIQNFTKTYKEKIKQNRLESQGKQKSSRQEFLKLISYDEKNKESYITLNQIPQSNKKQSENSYTK